VREKPVLEAVRNRMQVASRKNSQKNLAAAEAVQSNSAVRTIKTFHFLLLSLGTQQHIFPRTRQKNQLKTEHNWCSAILCPHKMRR
jgi:hypothetical protein